MFTADFGSSSRFETDPPNGDLEALAAVLVKCMEGRPGPLERSRGEFIAFIRKERGDNKVFGVENTKEWIGCKQLIDFLDMLLDEKVAVRSKLTRGVSLSRCLSPSLR